MTLSDAKLTQEGLPLKVARGKVLIIACGALAREILDLKAANGWTHIDLTCLPANYHLYPDKITGAVREMVAKHRGSYDNIFIAYADCGTGGLLQSACHELGVEMIAGPHCYSFFAGREIFDAMAEAELGTFYLTDYLVDNFERLILEGLGIKRYPELLDQYFEHYTRVVYLAQDASQRNREAKAMQAASNLGLPLEIHQTGLRPFEHAMATIAISAA